MSGVARYREWGLADTVVAACWQVDALRSCQDWLVLPDGAVDVLLAPGREPVVAGPATRPTVHLLQAGDRTVGVRLRPGAVGTALGLGAGELRDAVVPVARLRPAWREGAGRGQEALDRGDPGGAARLLAGAISRAGAAPAGGPDRIVRLAAAALAADPALGAGALAARLAVSPRHLRRRFADQAGLSPKRYARTMRLQRLLALRAAAPGASAGRLAAEAGYADHSHLVRECRELAGRTPSALLAQRAGVALDVA